MCTSSTSCWSSNADKGQAQAFHGEIHEVHFPCLWCALHSTAITSFKLWRNCCRYMRYSRAKHKCNCIAFKTQEEITMMLAERMPGTLKKLSDFQCLLPCLTCLRNGCHGCRQGLLHVEEEEGTDWSGRKTNKQWLTVGDPKEGPIAAIYEILDKFSITEEKCICICIPTHPAENDEWTKMLIIFNLKPIW